MLPANACDELMVVLAKSHATLQSMQHQVQLALDLALGSNGNPLLAPLSDQSVLTLCPLGSDESLELLVPQHLIALHGESFRHGLRAQQSAMSSHSLFRCEYLVFQHRSNVRKHLHHNAVSLAPSSHHLRQVRAKCRGVLQRRP